MWHITSGVYEALLYIQSVKSVYLLYRWETGAYLLHNWNVHCSRKPVSVSCFGSNKSKKQTWARLRHLLIRTYLTKSLVPCAERFKGGVIRISQSFCFKILLKLIIFVQERTWWKIQLQTDKRCWTTLFSNSISSWWTMFWVSYRIACCIAFKTRSCKHDTPWSFSWFFISLSLALQFLSRHVLEKVAPVPEITK